MKIFFINTNKYPLENNILEQYAEQNKKQQHCYGRYLVHNVAKKVFGIENSEIEIINKKPRFKNSKLQFSISHSENMIIVAFDENPIGTDIEIMKERNFRDLFARYNIKSDSKELFYKYWTEYEATIKLQGIPKTKIHKQIDNFMLSVVGDFDENYEIIDYKTII